MLPRSIQRTSASD